MSEYEMKWKRKRVKDMNRILSYFKKDVDVYVQYLHEDGIKKPETFNIYVIYKNQAHMLTNLLWSELDRVADF